MKKESHFVYKKIVLLSLILVPILAYALAIILGAGYYPHRCACGIYSFYIKHPESFCLIECAEQPKLTDFQKMVNALLFVYIPEKQNINSMIPNKLLHLEYSSIGPGNKEDLKIVAREISYKNYFNSTTNWETAELSESDYIQLQSHFNTNRIWEYEGTYTAKQEIKDIDINADYLGGSINSLGGANLSYKFILSKSIDSRLDAQGIVTISCSGYCPQKIVDFDIYIDSLIQKYF